ncbi:unnamed protein product [Schistosoma turkestanicum]|nr:unnamed protein product [Schistosoma turkestanicum]
MSIEQRYLTKKTVIQYGNVEQIQFVLLNNNIHLFIHFSDNLLYPQLLSCNVSHTIDPCDNFYQYACHDWEVNNPIPDDEERISTLSKADKNIDQYFYDLISNNSYASNDSRLFAVRQYYKACIDSAFDSDDRIKNQLFQLISISFGNWDWLPSSFNRNWDNKTVVLNLNLTDLYLPLISTTGHSPLFSLEVVDDSHTVRIYSGRLSSDQSFLSKRGFLLLKSMFHQAVDSLNLNQSNDESVNATFQLFDHLARNYLGIRSFPASKSKIFGKLDTLEAICPQIDWNYLFDTLFNETGFTAYKRGQIEIADAFLLQYLCGLHQIQLETEKGKSFMVEQTIHSLQRNNIGNAQVINQGSPMYFSPYCMERVKTVFPWTLEKYYLSSHIVQYDQTQVWQLVSEVRDTIIEAITQATWLDSDTKQFAKEKIQKIRSFVLYSDMNESERRENISAIYNYRMNSSNYLLNEYYAQKALYSDKSKIGFGMFGTKSQAHIPTYLSEAFYRGDVNTIYILAGLIQSPFYEKNEEKFIKFTGLGWIIAHELLHTIDIMGILTDEIGNLRPSQDSEAGLIAIMKQIDCLRDHYKFHSDTYEKSSRIGTQDEILADNGGLKIMYDTYRRVLTRQHVHSESEILSSDRSFFLKFAQAMCGNVRDEVYQYYQNNFPHLLHEYRVIGPLSNSEAFAQAYNCPTGSPMNPSRKCNLW